MNNIYNDKNKFSSSEEIYKLLQETSFPEIFHDVIHNILNRKRITQEEALLLYKKADLSLLSLLADYKNFSVNEKRVYFNKNIHIEPTNICVYNCKFCSYSRKKGDKESWVYTIDDIKNHARKYKDSNITEVHIVGGVHPDWRLKDYKKIIEVVKEELPKVIIKAYTAVEINYIAKKEEFSIKKILSSLKESGLACIPGGGAEIFDEKIRKKISPDKCNSKEWLEIHKTAHQLEIPTNATMLYGHIESYKHRVLHMNEIRKVQDETGRFSAFIPLKYRMKNNRLNINKEVSIIEDLRNYAVSRLFLDNINHIKAYWPMIGKQTSQLSLSFGVNDLDGTIDNTTKIYSMAGVEDQKPVISVTEIISLIKESNRIPVERDTFYNILKVY